MPKSSLKTLRVGFSFQVENGHPERRMNLLKQVVSGRVEFEPSLSKVTAWAPSVMPCRPMGSHKMLRRWQRGGSFIWIELVWVPQRADPKRRIWRQGIMGCPHEAGEGKREYCQ